MDVIGYALAQAIPKTVDVPGVNGVYKADVSPQIFDQGMALLPNGTILIVGGKSGSGDGISDTKAYDPVANTYTAKASPGVWRGQGVCALADGRVFACGNLADTGATKAVRLYDPTANTWATGTNPHPTADAYYYGGLTRQIPDGRVVVISNDWSASAEVRLWTPSTQAWASGTAMPTAGSVRGEVLPNGTILAVRDEATLASYAYDPVANTWTTKATIPNQRRKPGVVALTDGNVLFQGGEDNSSVARTDGHIYDYATNTWKGSGSSLAEGHAYVPAVRFNANNDAFIAGTYNSNTGWNKTEVVRPASTKATPGRSALLAYLASK